MRPISMMISRPPIRLLLLIAASVLVSACASTHRLKQPAKVIFYPPDAAAARLQFLTSFSSPSDLEPGPSALLTFAAGAPPPRPGIAKPYGVEASPGSIHVCDTASGVLHILDLLGLKWNFFAPDGQGRLRKPINVRVDADGTRYVTDTSRGQVVLFDRMGNYARSLGTPGELRPSDVAIAKDRLYVADLKSESVRVYRKDSLEFLFAIPRDEEKQAATEQEEKEREAFEAQENDKPEAKDGMTARPSKPNAKLSSPTNLALGQDGTLFVSDVGYYGVKHFDAEGHFLGQIGQHGDATGDFARNKGIAVDRAGRLYVVDAAFENVQIFDKEGRLLLHFGEVDAGLEGRMVLPAGIAVSYDNLDFFRPYVAPGRDIDYVVLVANQYGDNKINVYGFLRDAAAAR